MDEDGYDVNEESVEIYEEAKSSTVETETIVGSIGGIIAVILVVVVLIKLYYSLDVHCKKVAKNVRATTLSDESSSKKVVCVKWDNPKRSAFEKFTCQIRSYKIICGCSACKTKEDKQNEFHFLDKDKVKFELEPYREHRLQVCICYTGRIFLADHWTEPSDLLDIDPQIRDLNLVRAPPSKPSIKQVALNVNGIPWLVFEGPKYPNGRIVDYILRCKIECNVEGKEYPVNAKLSDGYLITTVNIRLQPLVTYRFSLAAISYHEEREYFGEWSDEYHFNVPAATSSSDPDASWTPQEWRILNASVIKAIAEKVYLLCNYLDISQTEMSDIITKCSLDKTHLTGIAIHVLSLWKSKHKRGATLKVLAHHLTSLQLTDIRESLESVCAYEGLFLHN